MLAVRDLRIPHAHHVVAQEHVTISVGIAVALPGMDVPQNVGKTTLLEQADQALYTAKQAGRNRCWMYGDPQPTPAEA